jgi:hypothetical protein
VVGRAVFVVAQDKPANLVIGIELGANEKLRLNRENQQQ